MHRRSFVRLLAAAGYAKATAGLDLAATQGSGAPLPGTFQKLPGTPALRVVSGYAAAAAPGMPGPYPGRVVSVSSDKCVDIVTGRADDEVVREMMARGMRALTGAGTTADAWRRFFEPRTSSASRSTVAGHPFCVSAYEIVAEIVRQLMGIGVPASQIYVYERFQNQLDEVNYAPHLPEGVQIVAAERANRNVDNSGYDPGHLPRGGSLRRGGHAFEHDAARVAPPDKDHQHPEHEGSRRHRRDGVPEEHRLRQLLERRAHTSARQVPHLFVRRHAGCGRALALAGRCCRSWTACAACGTAARSRERRDTCSTRAESCSAPIRSRSIACCSTSSRRSAGAQGAISIWDRSPGSLKIDDARARDADPNVNIIIREPGHVEYASKLGLGVYDRRRSSVQDITV